MLGAVLWKSRRSGEREPVWERGRKIMRINCLKNTARPLTGSTSLGRVCGLENAARSGIPSQGSRSFVRTGSKYFPPDDLFGALSFLVIACQDSNGAFRRDTCSVSYRSRDSGWYGRSSSLIDSETEMCHTDESKSRLATWEMNFRSFKSKYKFAIRLGLHWIPIHVRLWIHFEHVRLDHDIGNVTLDTYRLFRETLFLSRMLL